MAALHRPGDLQGGTPTLYLLFAGRHGHPAPGAGSLVGAFTSAVEARAAFRQIRLRLSDGEGWAELTAVAEGASPRVLSWFGIERPGRRDLTSAWLTATEPAASAADNRRSSPFRPFSRPARRQHG